MNPMSWMVSQEEREHEKQKLLSYRMDGEKINQCPEQGTFKGYLQYFMQADSEEDQTYEVLEEHAILEGPVTDIKDDYNCQLAEDVVIEWMTTLCLTQIFQVDSDKVPVSSDVTSLQNDHELQELPGIDSDSDGADKHMISPVPIGNCQRRSGCAKPIF